MSNTEQVELIFVPPTKASPGYLKRLAKILKFGKASGSGEMDPNDLEDLVEFLTDYVANEFTDENGAPLTDRELFKKRSELVWELSEEQFTQLMALVQQGMEEVTSEGN